MTRLPTWTAALALASALGCGGSDTATDLPETSARDAETEWNSPDIGGDELEGEAPDVAAAPSEGTGDERSAYVAQAEKSLDELERQIAELRQETGSSALAEEMEQTHARAEARLQDLKAAGESEWRQIRAELQQTIDDLEERYERATAAS